jgi:SPP1 family predicted phage head-tail adaptor
MVMKIGKLRHRIIFQTKTISYDSYNEPLETWTDSFTVWAEVVNSSGKELYYAQKVCAETSIVFKVRYNPEITGIMRVIYNNCIFDILSVIDSNGAKKELQIAAKEVV